MKRPQRKHMTKTWGSEFLRKQAISVPGRGVRVDVTGNKTSG